MSHANATFVRGQGDLYTDAYVAINFANQEERTQVQRKTLNPIWDEDFRFEVADDSVLQSEPIEFRVMDHDVYTRCVSPQLRGCSGRRPPPAAVSTDHLTHTYRHQRRPRRTRTCRLVTPSDADR